VQYNDPTHKRFFTLFTFDYFSKGASAYEVNGSRVQFKVKKRKINFGCQSKIMNKFFNPLLNLNQKFYCIFFAWIFPAAEIEYIITSIK